MADRLCRAMGPRYAKCRQGWTTYVVDCPEQRAVVVAIRDYLADFEEHHAAGNGIVLSGPSGTGKDHLLCLAGVGVALMHGVETQWVNGLQLWQRFRDAIKSDDYERELISEYTRPGVLIISDPLPPSGALTPYQATQFYTILDDRYRFFRPTWVSMNVAGRREADERIGGPTVDRIRDGALCLSCNWPSYRKAMKP